MASVEVTYCVRFTLVGQGGKYQMLRVPRSDLEGLLRTLLFNQCRSFHVELYDPGEGGL